MSNKFLKSVLLREMYRIGLELPTAGRYLVREIGTFCLGGHPTLAYQYDPCKMHLHLEWRGESKLELREPRLPYHLTTDTRQIIGG